MKHLNLIRKIAWNYHNNSGFDFEELYGEACLAYCLCIDKWEKERGALSTFLWGSITNSLKSYVEKFRRKSITGFDLSYAYDVEEIRTKSLMELFEKLSPEAETIARIVLNNPKPFIVREPARAKKRLVEVLINNGMPLTKIWTGMKDLETTFKN